jgi:2-polyprenyl-3-methyl-5-hydroxy-6-metoxy-1,4-benzoquinol methylase
MFSKRSHKKELLDGDVNEADLFLNLRELHSINQLLGGYHISINAFDQIKVSNQDVIVDLGFGGGEFIGKLYQHLSKKGVQCNISGVDLKKECANYASKHLPDKIKLITDDYKNIHRYFPNITIFHAALFCHHLTENEILDLIDFCQKGNITLIINDLERNSIAYYAIKVLTLLFSKSFLVKNDAPLSVLRGFKKSEWKSMLEKATISNYTIKWKWAFRHQIIIYGNTNI